MNLTKGSILRCVTPPDNKLYFIYIGDDMYIEMVNSSNCVKVIDGSNILKSDFFPVVNSAYLDNIEYDLAIMFDKVYIGNVGEVKCAFTFVTEVSEDGYNDIYSYFYELYSRGLLMQAKLSDRINEDILFMEGLKAIKENDLISFCNIYDQVSLNLTKVRLFFESGKVLNLPCVNACLKKGMYVDVRDENGNTLMSKILFLDSDCEDINFEGIFAVCKRLVISGASIDVALSYKPKDSKLIDSELIDNLRLLSKIRQEIQESSDVFE